MSGVVYKRCRSCNITKSIEEFEKTTVANTVYYRNECKKCRSEKNKRKKEKDSFKENLNELKSNSCEIIERQEDVNLRKISKQIDKIVATEDANEQIRDFFMNSLLPFMKETFEKYKDTECSTTIRMLLDMCYKIANKVVADLKRTDINITKKEIKLEILSKGVSNFFEKMLVDPKVELMAKAMAVNRAFVPDKLKKNSKILMEENKRLIEENKRLRNYIEKYIPEVFPKEIDYMED